MLLIVPGDKKVNLEQVALILKSKKVRLISFDLAEQVSGYLPGATPSIGHKMKMRTVMDKSLMKYDTIYCGGGTGKDYWS